MSALEILRLAFRDVDAGHTSKSSLVTIVLRCATIHSGLSYWSDYFSPEGRATRPGFSTGWIAERLYGILSERGTVDYWDYAQRPIGANADVFVGHFWAFAELCRQNNFCRPVAVYVLSDPVRAATLLHEAATRYGVPYPDWDLPPSDLDHEAAMELADAVILLGNSHHARHLRRSMALEDHARQLRPRTVQLASGSHVAAAQRVHLLGHDVRAAQGLH